MFEQDQPFRVKSDQNYWEPFALPGVATAVFTVRLLKKVFFPNLLVIALNQLTALKQITLGQNTITPKKDVQSNLWKWKLWFLLLRNPPHLCKCAYSRKYPKSIIQFHWILLFQQQSMHISEYVGDLSPEWRKVKNIFQTRPCSKVDVKAGLKDGSLFLLLKF